MSMSRRGLLLFAAMCVIWGVPYLLIRVAVGEISPATLVFVRTAIAAVILLPLVLARGGWRSIGGRWPALVAFAAVEVAMPWFFLSSAEQHITSALAGLLISAVPLVGVVIATALGNREHLGLASMSGLLVGLVGVALIVGFDLRASDATALVEIALVVSATRSARRYCLATSATSLRSQSSASRSLCARLRTHPQRRCSGRTRSRAFPFSARSPCSRCCARRWHSFCSSR